MAAAARPPLDAKELKLLRKATESLDEKHFKVALKHVDLLIKERKPDAVHGSVLALKGLVLVKSSQEDAVRAEGLALCKQGVMASPDSCHAWRYFAIAHLHLKMYPLASKSLAQAIAKSTPSDIETRFQSQRELCQVHAMNKNWTALVKLRQDMASDVRIAQLRWASADTMQLGVIVALHLAGQLAQAIEALDAFIDRLNDPLPIPRTELILYRVQLLAESKDFKGALAYVDSRSADVLDVLGLAETRAGLLLETGDFAGARTAYEALLQRNPENYPYHAGLQQAVVGKSVARPVGATLQWMPVTRATTSQEDRDKVLQVYDDLRPSYPESMAFARIPLGIATGARLKSLITRYLDEQSPNRAPALFSSLKNLYKVDREVPGIAEAAMQARLATASTKERPWILHFLAKHCDFMGQLEAAFKHIDEALVLEPTEADFFLCRARLLKHAGDLQGAADCLDQARKMEPTDRYMNNKTIKYMLRAHKPELALSLANLFVRTDDKSPQLVLAELHEMQAMWFEYESAAAALKRGNVIETLKQCQWIEKHFDQFEDDMFDFHEFSLRKCTLRSYIGLLRSEASVRSAAMFRSAQWLALEAVFKVHDTGAGKADLAKQRKLEEAVRKAAADDADESRFAGMTPTERKLAMAKLKKERLAQAQAALAQQQKEAAAAAASVNAEEEDGDKPATKPAAPASELASMLLLQNQGHPKKKLDVQADPDPQGLTLFESVLSDPLKHAQRMVDALLRECPEDVETHLRRFDVAIRKRQTDVCLEALETATRLSGAGFASNAGIVARLLPFAYFAGQGAAASTTWRAKAAQAVTLASDELRARLSALIVPEQVEATALRLLGDADPHVVVAAGEALLAMDKAKHAAGVETALDKVQSPLLLALAARAVLQSAGVGARHLEALGKKWPLAGKLLKN